MSALRATAILLLCTTTFIASYPNGVDPRNIEALNAHTSAVQNKVRPQLSSACHSKIVLCLELSFCPMSKTIYDALAGKCSISTL